MLPLSPRDPEQALSATPFATPLMPGLPGLGWYPLLIALHRQLSEVDPGYQVQQVRQKMGTLRVYCRFRPEVADRCQEMVWRTERASAHICERCSEPARLRSSLPAARTLCDACASAAGYTD